MTLHTKTALIVFIEPTPYIVRRAEILEEKWPGKLEVIFLTQNLSQRWNMALPPHYRIAPKGGLQKILFGIQHFFKIKPDIIHVAGWSEPACQVLLLLSRLYGRVGCVESDTQISYATPLWKRGLKRMLFPIFFEKPDLYFPGGQQQSRYLKKYGVPDFKIHIAQMTVDVNTLQRFFKSLTHADKLNCRAENTTDSDAVIFLFVGRLLDWKGVRELIEAFNGLTHPKAWLWIVGEGDLTAEVNLAAERNPKIRALGRRSDEDLWRIYAASDVVVVPSYEEPWGLVVNEAMAAAKPVIGSNRVGCVEDLVFHESTGLVIEPKDVGALQNAMQWLLDHPLSRVEMGQAAATLMKKWTLEDEVDNIIEGWGRFFGECETD